jgi:hypothetical protein
MAIKYKMLRRLHSHVVSTSFTPWTIGFDFRSTLAYVTDPTDSVFWNNETYPTIKTSALGQSVTAGWQSTSQLGAALNNSTGVDVRLAGSIANLQNTVPSVFQIALPAPGVYDIVAAWGVTGGSEASLTAAVLDNSTQLFQYFRQSVVTSNFLDATGTAYLYSAWPGSQTAKRVTFTSSICNMSIGNNGDSGQAPVAHFHLNRIS